MPVHAYEVLADLFAREGVSTVFTLTGDANMHWAHTMATRHGVRLINTRHEHAACTAATSYARISGRTGVASVTCGPGFTQIMTALATASRARVPLVVFAGESPIGTKFHNQRIDQQPFATAAGAHYIQVHSAKRLAEQTYEAFHVARRSQQPVVVGVPHDVQQIKVSAIETYLAASSRPGPSRCHPDPAEIEDVAKRLQQARKSIFIAGRGVLLAGARAQVLQLAERCGALLSETLPAKGLFDGEPFNLGIAGGFSSDLALELFADADLVLAVGASLSSHTLHGGKLCPRAQVIQIDIEPLGFRHGMVSADVSVTADALACLNALLTAVKPTGDAKLRTASIATRIASERDRVEFPIETGTFDPRDVIASLDAVIPKDWLIVSGSGHSAYFTTLLRGRSPDRFFTMREFGAVGNGLSYALGAVAAGNDGKVLLLEGDGGFLMHAQELETIRRHGMKLVIGVMNDGGYGAEVQKFRADGIDPAIVTFGRPDFASIANGFGLDGRRVTETSQFGRDLASYANAERAMLWDIPISDKVVSLYQRRQAKH